MEALLFFFWQHIVNHYKKVGSPPCTASLSETRVLRLPVHLCHSQHLSDAYTAEKAPHRSHLHSRGVVCALSAWVLDPAVPPHHQRAAPHAATWLLCPAWPRLGALQGDCQQCQARFDCRCCFLCQVSDLWFLFKLPPSLFEKSLDNPLVTV